ncbi:MAG TPA: hypothetical protein VD905_04105, partial [Flavobacteriales bacterium]|nr:hypothetical protein [Flavobacteriales bacterium]
HTMIIENSGTGVALTGVGFAGNGVVGQTSATNSSFAGVVGQTTTNLSSGVRGYSTHSGGTGVTAENTAGGLALNVNGKLKIAGGNTSPGSGKILTSDANGNATWQAPPVATTNKVGFHIRGIAPGGYLNIPNATPYRLPFANETYDAGNNYTLYNQGTAQNPASSFTAPISGFYQFNAITRIASMFTNYEVENASIYLVVKRNGVVEKYTSELHYSSSTYEEDITLRINTAIHLSAGDQVWVEIDIDTDDDSNPVFSQGTYQPWHSFSGFLVFAD